jgi:N-ethylmaleimide reductase
MALSTSTDLFRPVKVGALTLNNRIALAPLTRSRAPGPDGIPGAMNALEGAWVGQAV